MTKRPAYQTDINDTAWTIIESKLPKIKQTGRPRTYELREIVNALFYVRTYANLATRHFFFKKKS